MGRALPATAPAKRRLTARFVVAAGPIVVNAERATELARFTQETKNAALAMAPVNSSPDLAGNVFRPAHISQLNFLPAMAARAQANARGQTAWLAQVWGRPESGKPFLASRAVGMVAFTRPASVVMVVVTIMCNAGSAAVRGGLNADRNDGMITRLRPS